MEEDKIWGKMLKGRKICIIRVENENIIHGIRSLNPKKSGVRLPPPSTPGKNNFSKILEIDSKGWRKLASSRDENVKIIVL